MIDRWWNIISNMNRMFMKVMFKWAFLSSYRTFISLDFHYIVCYLFQVCLLHYTESCLMVRTICAVSVESQYLEDYMFLIHVFIYLFNKHLFSTYYLTIICILKKSQILKKYKAMNSMLIKKMCKWITDMQKQLFKFNSYQRKLH